MLTLLHASTTISVGHTGVLNNYGKIKIYKKYQSDISKDRIKNLDEDTQRYRKQCRFFLNTATKVLT